MLERFFSFEAILRLGNRRFKISFGLQALAYAVSMEEGKQGVETGNGITDEIPRRLDSLSQAPVGAMN
jgi:translation elongation factor EF-1beta